MADIKEYVSSKPRTGIGTALEMGLTSPENDKRLNMAYETTPSEQAGAGGDNKLQIHVPYHRGTSQIKILYTDVLQQQDESSPTGDHAFLQTGLGKKNSLHLEDLVPVPLYSFSETLDVAQSTDEDDDFEDLSPLSMSPRLSKICRRTNSNSSSSSEEEPNLDGATVPYLIYPQEYKCVLCPEGDSPQTHNFNDDDELFPTGSVTRRFKLTKILMKQGNEGKVFKVIDEQETYALKVHCMQGSEDGFLKEVDILQKLSHPNVVKVLGHCHECRAIKMEYASGGDLATLASKKEGLPEDEVVFYFTQVAEGLRYLHDKEDIIHCDIKGDNLLLNGVYQQPCVVKIADFGIAAHLNGRCELEVTRGTRAFMAPEVIARKTCSKASDVFSVGCCMVQSLIGSPRIRKEGRVEIPLGICSDKLRGIIERCLEKDRKQRPFAADLLEDLKRLQMEQLNDNQPDYDVPPPAII